MELYLHFVASLLLFLPTARTAPSHSHSESPHELPGGGGYSIHRDQITLSGLSTGGTFAQIFHLAHSRYFSGIGIFSSYFWKCGDYSPSLEQMYATCGNPGGYDTQGKQPKPGAAESALALTTLGIYENENKIDKLDNLADQRIFMWQGTVDEYITPNNGLSALDIYEPHLNSPHQIYTKIQYAHHHFPTVSTGTPCQLQSDPREDAFLGKCHYYGAYHMLSFLLTGEPTGLDYPSGDQVIEELIIFDQTEFMRNENGDTYDIGLADEGFLYVPRSCKSGAAIKCFLHFYFHGCYLTRAQIGTRHIEGSGILQVAELNNVIVVFPMAEVTSFNTGGCFDSFGYNGVNYATKRSAQVETVWKMMKRLLNSTENDENTAHAQGTSHDHKEPQQ